VEKSPVNAVEDFKEYTLKNYYCWLKTYYCCKCLKKNKGTGVSQPEYAKIIGSVMFLMNYNRSNIAYVFNKFPDVLEGYCDANWVFDNDEVSSTSGQEAEWLRNLLADIPLWKKQSVPVFIHCDSQAAIGIAKYMVYNGKKRHIRIRHGIVKELLKME
nr:ATP phosphoribosyltransferase 1, chloroplastic [Tanacetum cinerariifolium]